MSLDSTARSANIRDSIKKYFVTNLSTTEGLFLSFDTSLSTPNIQGTAVDKWVMIRFGDLDRKFGSHILNVYCCTRKDSEGFKLCQLTDKVMGYLTDATQTDGMARIPLYRSSATESWTLLDGGFVVIVEGESSQYESEDDTKFVIINIRLRWGAKI